jgi:hypothetical protein
MNRILTVLRTPGAMLAALVLALIAQLEHTAQVFMLVVGATGWQAQLHAYSFALAVETAVLLFVLAGHKRISYAFAFATFATNLSYYAMAGVDLLSVQGAPAWLMSLLLPAAIMGYSHTIAERGDDARGKPTATPTETPVARPEGMTGHSSETVTTANDATEAATDTVQPVAVPTPTVAPARKRAPVVRKRKPAKLDATQRRAQIAESGVTDVSAIMAQFGVKLRTAQEDVKQVRAATLAQNGSTHHA